MNLKGFKRTRYEGQKQKFFTRICKVKDYPKILNIVKEEYFDHPDIANEEMCVEIILDTREIQVYIPNIDYLLCAESVYSKKKVSIIKLLE